MVSDLGELRRMDGQRTLLFSEKLTVLDAAVAVKWTERYQSTKLLLLLQGTDVNDVITRKDSSAFAVAVVDPVFRSTDRERNSGNNLR